MQNAQCEIGDTTVHSVMNAKRQSAKVSSLPQEQAFLDNSKETHKPICEIQVGLLPTAYLGLFIGISKGT